MKKRTTVWRHTARIVLFPLLLLSASPSLAQQPVETVDFNHLYGEFLEEADLLIALNRLYDFSDTGFTFVEGIVDSRGRDISKDRDDRQRYVSYYGCTREKEGLRRRVLVTLVSEVLFYDADGNTVPPPGKGAVLVRMDLQGFSIIPLLRDFLEENPRLCVSKDGTAV